MKIEVELTKEDMALIQMMWDGVPNKMMEVKLGLSHGYLDYNIRAIYTKYGVKDRMGMIRFAVRNKIVK
jgi:DNA-binding NarL/FixJ family response regulator